MQRRTSLPDPRLSPRYAGISTFGRYPRLQDVSPEHSPVDWAIYGVPYDGGVTFRPGARFGPRAIRDASQYLKPYSIEHKLDVCSVLSLADAGDSPVSPYSCHAMMETQAAFALGLGDRAATRLMAIGGDHSIAYANIRATWERRGRPAGGFALLHFDSHVDTLDQTLGERWSHASPFSRAVEDGFIDPRRMLSLGIRGPINDTRDLEFAERTGGAIVTYEDWRWRDGASRLAAFVSSLSGAECYITFDIDCVDPAFAPGTGTPCSGGFTSAEVLMVLRSLRGINVAGADVVEVLPDCDVGAGGGCSGITAYLAAHVMFEILCLDAARRPTVKPAAAPG